MQSHLPFSFVYTLSSIAVVSESAPAVFDFVFGALNAFCPSFSRHSSVPVDRYVLNMALFPIHGFYPKTLISISLLLKVLFLYIEMQQTAKRLNRRKKRPQKIKSVRTDSI